MIFKFTSNRNVNLHTKCREAIKQRESRIKDIVDKHIIANNTNNLNNFTRNSWARKEERDLGADVGKWYLGWKSCNLLGASG